MDEEGRRKLAVYAICQLRRSCLQRRRMVALLLHHMGRCRRQIEEHRNFLRQAEITMRQNLAAILSFFAAREPPNKRFGVIPRPQHWFDMLLARHDFNISA